MSEDKENIPATKGGLSDKLVSLKVKLLETPPQPGHFDERLHPDPEDQSKVIVESEMPVVLEAEELLGEARETGRLVSEHVNPFGNIRSLKLEVIGDIHVTGGSPNESVESRSPVLRKLQDLGPRSRGVKSLIKEVPPEFGLKYYTVQEYMESGDYIEPVTEVGGFQGTGTDWAHEVRPSISIQGFRAIGEALINDISRSHEFLREGSATVIVDIGDKSNTEATIGDIALNAIEWENLRKRAEIIAAETGKKPAEISNLHQSQDAIAEQVKHLKRQQGIEVDGLDAEKTESGTKIFMTCPEGNHDNDLNNKGIANEAIKRKLYGSQIFYQEVGDEYAVLAINTNFESAFWWENFRLQKGSELTDEQEETIRGIEEEIKLQKELIKKAQESGRKIVVLAHEAELVNQAMPLKESKMTHIIAGHLHEAKNEPLNDKNGLGNQVQLVRVGATFVGMTGWEKVQKPVGYAISIKEDSESEQVFVEELKTPDYSENMAWLE